jgi:hypothetical protein
MELQVSPTLPQASRMSNSMTVTNTGLVYRNPKPHLRAIHAMHPTISLLLPGGASCRL